jgi:hypothetical protein
LPSSGEKKNFLKKKEKKEEKHKSIITANSIERKRNGI